MDDHNRKEKEVGFVTQANNYLVSLNGLPSARVNDLVIGDDGNKGLVASLEEDVIRALLLEHGTPKAGDRFVLQQEGMQFPVGDFLFGRIVDTLGSPIDGRGGLPRGKVPMQFDVVAPGIEAREEIREQFETGVALVDTLFPIGRGQRQLLFGPTSSGKTTFIRDIIVNQKDKNVICIYAAIGKSTMFIERFAKSIYGMGAEPYTIILGALAEATTPMITIAPTVAFFVAEHFRKQGKHVLLILDDLGTHAKYMRETALLMERIPGRQSYPGDIFYQHAHLLERAGNFNEKFGKGSITVFPVLETDIENFTDLIPTNVMATTDGHLFFDPQLRAEGRYPSIALERSVTRVGHQTQRPIRRELSTRLMALFAEYNRQREYMQFGTNIGTQTKQIIRQGEVATELLKQEIFDNYEEFVQIAMLGLTFTPLITNRDVSFIRNSKEKMIKAIREDAKLQEVRDAAERAASLNEFLEKLNRNAYLIEKACLP